MHPAFHGGIMAGLSGSSHEAETRGEDPATGRGAGAKAAEPWLWAGSLGESAWGEKGRGLQGTLGAPGGQGSI